jgi:ATP synthase protein I
MSEDRREMIRQLAIYSNAGGVFVFSIVIGFGIGWFLDNKVFGGRTSPVLSFVFLGFGIAAGFKHLWDLTKKLKDE